MTQTAGTTGTTGTTQTPTTSVVNNAPSSQLGKDDFLKMLVAQMQNQDPSNPTDDTQMAAQLAQFSSLEQMTNVAESVDQLSATTSVSQSFALIGHEIAYTNSDGSTAGGTVDGVSLQNGAAVLDVDGVSVTPDSVIAVGGTPSTDSSTQSTSA